MTGITNHFVLEDKIQAEVRLERLRQMSKFPVQARDGLENGNGPEAIFAGHRLDYYERVAKSACNGFISRYGTAPWVLVLLEEVFEACAAGCTEDLRGELIQVQAVAQAWVEDIDSKAGDEKERLVRESIQTYLDER